MTLSLAGRCARTGQFGVVISSSSPAVAARCAYARAGVGAACSQNITDPRLGVRLLDLMASGRSAVEAIDEVVAREPLIVFRQLTAIDSYGTTGAFSGERTLGTHATASGVDCVTAGNLLADHGVPAAMVAAFERDSEAELEERLIDALRAGLETGGEVGPVHSAGIVVSADVPWYVTDLRIDWSVDPLREIEALWAIWKPQKSDYLRRALDPGAAPAYRVPGDLGIP